MPSIEQIKAARALIGWSQKDLADHADLSQTGIARLENGTHQPNTKTMNKIVRAFNKEGVTFTDNGVEKNEYPIYHTQSDTHEQAYLKLLADVETHLLDVEDPELLIMFSDDSVSPPSVNDTYRRLRNAGVKMRQLVKEGNHFIMGPLNEYRFVPEEFFINRVTLIYGDRIANEKTDPCQGMIRVDPVNANIQRNMFDFLWRILEQPKESKADARF